MMGPGKVLALCSCLCSSAAAGSAPGRIPLTITSAADEQMAKRLASAVMKELRRDPRFSLAERPASGRITLSLPHGVGWQRRLDWTEISYQARLDGRGASRIAAGHCWNWNLSVCAKQILDSAAQYAAS